jgi:hypothetical protein
MEAVKHNDLSKLREIRPDTRALDFVLVVLRMQGFVGHSLQGWQVRARKGDGASLYGRASMIFLSF